MTHCIFYSEDMFFFLSAAHIFWTSYLIKIICNFFIILLLISRIVNNFATFKKRKLLLLLFIMLEDRLVISSDIWVENLNVCCNAYLVQAIFLILLKDASNSGITSASAITFRDHRRRRSAWCAEKHPAQSRDIFRPRFVNLQTPRDRRNHSPSSFTFPHSISTVPSRLHTTRLRVKCVNSCLLLILLFHMGVL